MESPWKASRQRKEDAATGKRKEKAEYDLFRAAKRAGWRMDIVDGKPTTARAGWLSERCTSGQQQSSSHGVLWSTRGELQHQESITSTSNGVGDKPPAVDAPADNAPGVDAPAVFLGPPLLGDVAAGAADGPEAMQLVDTPQTPCSTSRKQLPPYEQQRLVRNFCRCCCSCAKLLTWSLRAIVLS